jgi:PleD family two-component response regulator
VTIGVAPYRPDASIDDLIREADAAMYRGKAAGRNQVVGP